MGDVREEGRLSGRQELLLRLNFLLASAFIMIPAMVIKGAGKDGWMSIILAALAGIGMTALYTVLGRRFPGRTLVQYSRLLLGKFAGNLIGLMMMWFALHLGALVLRNFGDFLAAALMPETPYLVFHVLIILVISLALYGGLEVLGRFNEILTWIVVTSILSLLILTLSIEDFDLKNLLPVLEEGIGPALKTSLLPFTFPFGETVLFTMLLPYLNKPEEARKAPIMAMIYAGLLLATITLVVLAVFGVASLLYLPIRWPGA